MATVRFIDDNDAAREVHGYEMQRRLEMVRGKLPALTDGEMAVIEWLYQSAFDSGVDAERWSL